MNALSWSGEDREVRMDCLSAEEILALPQAPALGLSEAASLLACPEDVGPLTLGPHGAVATDGFAYPMAAGSPVLLPRAALAPTSAPWARLEAHLADPVAQYAVLARTKAAGGDPNTPLEDVWYRRHLFRSREMLRQARGLVLDVGCDDPDLSRRLFPPSSRYLGLEPTLPKQGPFRIVGWAEKMPVRSGSLDACAFLTSLDHMLDHHSALEEAHRVLKPGGELFFAALVWTDRATLLRDNIHFHHFRGYELAGALAQFDIRESRTYDWKGDAHRFGIYLRAVKP